ncbi:MAG: hypothetical protein J6V24_02660 [Clostridia bacterium]|nr:hypothetical protein [Clostridia bacterium]
MRKRTKILLVILASLLAVLGGVLLYFALDLQIPPSKKLVKLYFTDVFRGRHTVHGEGAEAFVLTVEGVREIDTVQRKTLYAFTSECGGGSFWYPGTPKGQICGVPRLRRGERLVMIGGEAGERQQSVWFFKIAEFDGVEYVYPLLYDEEIIPLSVLGESLSFRDDDERRIYDPWYDEDVYKYLAKIGRAAPAYKYKTTLENLLGNVRKLTQSGGR